ncbi:MULTISPECIES: GntR family transcriptional regulator [unclassified Amycolatopsis]|uniref:GntR family transcriptional regulator n=1 Tax=unclassified Amycolatopsis TaxID=2618356 RepID=UPI001C696613|nr:GntR family transcriptional regulator [Amycolatopsis sp. DSM 110486]QYN19420.1 GntR family transcriptional regulator [Amycolatopsis sp. DSM 110486]
MPTTPKEGEVGKHAALDALRAALLAGDVVPGQRLVEAELAETFGVTRASMRAALIDLTAEGLVERIPHRGARVRVVSIEEAVAITECRMVLEGLCAAKAAEKVSDDEIDSLRELAKRLQAAVDEGESMKYSELNRELHRTVREIAGQSVAAELLERLHGQIVRHQFRLAMRAGRPHVSLPEHLAIIDAIARRDPDAAEQAARAHLRSVITALRETDN